MKSFLLTVLGILCGVLLVLGNMYWNERTAVSSFQTEAKSSDDKEISAPKEEVSEEKEVADLTANWPENARKGYEKAVSEGRAYKVAIVGSQALGADPGGWSSSLKNSLKDAYGETLEVDVFSYDTNSIDFVNGEDVDKVLDYAPDLVLYEPFALNDNFVGVAPEDNHDTIEIFLRLLKEANGDVVLILQPTHPLVEATYYPQQVEQLKEFADEIGITYLDHWTAWPQDETLEGYISESKEAPTEEGHKVWADYLSDYFITD
jgi:hypothetical protein